jgi:hypothetical protein
VRQWRRFNFKFMLALVSKRVDYMTNSSIAFLFPGQGSQAVGMGGALAASHAAAKQVFEEINDALGENLFAIMQDGPDDAIRMTRNAQPALFATSMAAVRVLEAELGAPLSSRGGMTAGHSLGEYAALAASGSLSISDAARLLRQRGDSMQSAVPVGEGAMAAILGGDEDQINAILADAKSSGLVQIANDNAPGQIVISGAAAAVDAAIEIAKAAGLRRAIKLPCFSAVSLRFDGACRRCDGKIIGRYEFVRRAYAGLLQCVGRCRDARRSFAGKSCHTGHGAGSVARITDGNERCRCNQIYRAWDG